MQYELVNSYTRLDGSSDLYIAQERLMPGFLAYPIPHNAPYAQQFDKWIGITLQVNLGQVVSFIMKTLTGNSGTIKLILSKPLDKRLAG